MTVSLPDRPFDMDPGASRDGRPSTPAAQALIASLRSGADPKDLENRLRKALVAATESPTLTTVATEINRLFGQPATLLSTEAHLRTEVLAEVFLPAVFLGMPGLAADVLDRLQSLRPLAGAFIPSDFWLRPAAELARHRRTPPNDLFDAADALARPENALRFFHGVVAFARTTGDTDLISSLGATRLTAMFPSTAARPADMAVAIDRALLRSTAAAAPTKMASRL